MNTPAYINLSFHNREGHFRIVQYLLDMFPNIWDTVSNNGRTPLHTAGMKLHCFLYVVPQTSLILSSLYCLTSALHGHLETIELLLKRFVSLYWMYWIVLKIILPNLTPVINLNSSHYGPDCMDSCGTTPLMDSIRGDFVDVAALLVTKVIYDKQWHHAVPWLNVNTCKFKSNWFEVFLLTKTSPTHLASCQLRSKG